MSLFSAASSASVAVGGSPQPLPANTVGAEQYTATNKSNLPIPPPSPQAEPPSQLLLAYLSTTVAKQHYDGAILPFLTLHKELQSAKESLEKFKVACNKRGAAQLSLPQSLKLSIVERARLPTVEGQPDMFKEELKELQSIESEATKRTAEVLLKAKEKHIAALQSKANAQSFKAKASSVYLEFLTQHAKEFDELQGASSTPNPAGPAAASASAGSASPASSSQPLRFPLVEAQHHFEQHINSRVDSTVFDLLAKQQERLERKKRQHEESVAAKEQILQGATSGQTLTALANKAAQSAIAPLQRELHRMSEQSKRQKTEHRAATRAPATVPSTLAQSVNSQLRPRHKLPRAPRRSESRFSHPNASVHSSLSSTPAAVRTPERDSRPAPAAATAHTTQQAHTPNSNRSRKRRFGEHTEQSNNAERVVKHLPDSRSNPRHPIPPAPPRAVPNFRQGGDRDRPSAPRPRDPRSNNTERPQGTSGKGRERIDRRQ